MNWGYGPGMMDWYGGGSMFSLFAFLFWLVSFIDLVLLGIWLFKQIRKSK